jgi:hypothetical protein
MITIIDSFVFSVVLLAPLMPVLYALMLSVADAIISAVKNWKYMSIKLRPHQLDWLEQIHNGGKRVLVLAPRGHGKSTIIRCYIMFRICMDPDIKILMASHVESLAKLQARAIQMYIELPMIQQDFGFSKGRPWSVSTFHLAGKIQPVMATVAARGGMVGKRFDIVIFDDLLSLETCINETSREKILNWIRAEVLPAIDPYDSEEDDYDKEKMIVIGTRKHQHDWYSQLLVSDLYTKVMDVAHIGDEYLWPEKFNKEVLDMKLLELGPRLFAQEYMNEVTPSEGMAFRREWLRYYDELPKPYMLKYCMGIDPSLGSKERRASLKPSDSSDSLRHTPRLPQDIRGRYVQGQVEPPRTGGQDKRHVQEVQTRVYQHRVGACQHHLFRSYDTTDTGCLSR